MCEEFGWLNLYKPIGMSSNKALSIVKHKLRIKKAGYLGTLDPLAEGVLPIAFGKSTKEIFLFLENKKSYKFTMKWGEKTSTGDTEGEVLRCSNKHPSIPEIESSLIGFIGEIFQSPHLYSAVKIDGKRAYLLAREGKIFSLRRRKVNIESLKIVGTPTNNSTVLEMYCGKGVYVRSLVEDLAEKLGTYAHVTTLIRTYYHPFVISNARSIADISRQDILPLSSFFDQRV